MFSKVHIRLTLLCGGITALILIIMSLVYLYVSESGLRSNHFLAFQRDMSTLVPNLETQTVISHEWLSKLEQNGSYMIYLTDNGSPLLYNTRKKSKEAAALQTAAMDHYYANPAASSGADDQSYHTEYTFRYLGTMYHASLAVVPRHSGVLTMLVLSPLTKLEQQMDRQRYLFLLIIISSVFLLFLFSWHFTRLLLKPIEQNREEQVRFIASASHELRTPLAVILSCLDAIKKASPEEAKGFLLTVQGEGLRMSRLIDDMLLLSKADSHSFDIHPEETEPDTLLLTSYEAFQPMAAGKGLSLQIKLPEEPISPCLCDRARLSQIIAILLDNAVSYTPAGGQIWLTLSCCGQTGQTFTMAVADSGPGIPDSEKEQIFRRFYRPDRSRSAREHFGLGLCIAAELSKVLGGSIAVTDREEGGAIFAVTIPMRHPTSS